MVIYDRQSLSIGMRMGAKNDAKWRFNGFPMIYGVYIMYLSNEIIPSEFGAQIVFRKIFYHDRSKKPISGSGFISSTTFGRSNFDARV